MNSGFTSDTAFDEQNEQFWISPKMHHINYPDLETCDDEISVKRSSLMSPNSHAPEFHYDNDKFCSLNYMLSMLSPPSCGSDTNSVPGYARLYRNRKCSSGELPFDEPLLSPTFVTGSTLLTPQLSLNSKRHIDSTCEQDDLKTNELLKTTQTAVIDCESYDCSRHSTTNAMLVDTACGESNEIVQNWLTHGKLRCSASPSPDFENQSSSAVQPLGRLSQWPETERRARSGSFGFDMMLTEVAYGQLLPHEPSELHAPPEPSIQSHLISRPDTAKLAHNLQSSSTYRYLSNAESSNEQQNTRGPACYKRPPSRKCFRRCRLHDEDIKWINETSSAYLSSDSDDQCYYGNHASSDAPTQLIGAETAATDVMAATDAEVLHDLPFPNKLETLMPSLKALVPCRPANPIREKRWQCSYCGLKFTQRGGLRNHERLHTGIKPYACSICLRRFTQKANCVRHVTTHRNEKPFKCKLCNKAFVRKWGLAQHIKKVHLSELGIDDGELHQYVNTIAPLGRGMQSIDDDQSDTYDNDDDNVKSIMPFCL